MEENKIPGFVTELINYLIGIRNLSEVYVNNMKVTIEQFLDFLNIHKFKNKYKTIAQITLNDIRSLNNSDFYGFIFFLAENKYKLNSRVVKTEHLRTFFDYLFRIKHTIFTEPFKKIKCERKIEQKLPNYLSLEEAKRVLNAYSNNSRKNDKRDMAILHLFFKTKLKVSEISNIDIKDIRKFDENTINIINDYLEIRKKLKNNTNALFLSNYNERISTIRIKKIIKDAYYLINNHEKLSINEIQANITEDQANTILNSYTQKTSITTIRNNAILHLFLNCGLRLSEVSNLNIDDIDLFDDRFTILGKGNKERTGFLNASTKAVLLEYLKIRKEMNVKTKALFLSNYNKRISATSLKRIVKNAYLIANIENDEYSVHTLRHTCATILYRAGTHIKTIQELLGHVRIDTTEIYTHLHNEEVRDAMFGHPLSKFKISDAIPFFA